VRSAPKPPSPVTLVPRTVETATPQIPTETATAPKPVTLTVLAAASLTESFTEIGKAFEAVHPGVTVAISFAGSQQLAAQLDEGAPADVFASANNKYMQQEIDSSRVAPGTEKTLH